MSIRASRRSWFNEMRSARAPLAASFGVAMIFSAHYLTAKVVLAAIPASSLAATRGLVGGVVLMIAFHRAVRRYVTRRHLPALVGVAALGFCINQLLMFEGLARTTATDVALISSLIPVVATLLAMAVGIDRPDLGRVFGTLLGLGVVAWYIMRLNSIDLSQHATGNLLVFANVVSFCIALLTSKRFLQEVPPEVVSCMMLTLGGLGLWVTGGDLRPVVGYVSASPVNFALILFEALVTTAVAYTLNLWALQRLSVATTTVFNYLQPPLTAVLAWLAFGQVPTSALAMTFAGVVGACIIVSRTEERMPERSNNN